MDCVFNSKTIRAAANFCKTANTTSFRWRHRFLEIIKHQNKDKQTVIVEFTEKIMRTNFKGCRNIDNEKEKYNLGKLIMFLFSKDRASKVQDQIFSKLGIKSISDSLNLKLDKDILFCTEDKELYKQISENHRLRHGFINLKNGEKIKKDIVHLNNINKYKNDFVNWLEIFRGVATKYLVNYIAWHRFFDANNHNCSFKSYFASI
jgi:hypothetical protein